MPDQLVSTSPTLAELRDSFELSLRAGNKSPRTLTAYLSALDLLGSFLADKGMPRHLSGIRREHVEAFIAHQLDAFKPATANNRFRSLQAFWKWAKEEGEVEESPMARMSPPKVPEQPPPVLTDDQIESLLKACDGRTFIDRRDMALVRLFLSTGARRDEVASLELEHVNLKEGSASVVGKGGRIRWLQLGDKVRVALDRYLRMRRQHSQAQRPEFWLGHAGPLTGNGIAQIIKKRAMKAGLDGIHPHMFRHWFAHNWLVQGGQESDLMALAGWQSRTMLTRYAASRAQERAREAHKRLAPGDQF